jgi:hypothetical protein
MSNILSPLIPIIVMCCQQPLMVVRLPDGRVGVTLQSLCEALNLNRPGQLQRIRRNWALAEHLVLVPLMTKSGLQHMDVLMVEAISKWLVGIQIDRLAPEKRPIARALQKDAERDIAQHFSKMDTEQATQPAKTPSKPHGTSKEWVEADALSSLPDDRWEQLYQIIAGFENEWRSMKADMASMKADIARLKATQEQKPAGAAQKAEDRLSPDHFLHLYVLARSLKSRTGEPLGAVMRELAAAFHMTDIGELPDSAWDAILSWFWQRSQR